MSKNGNFNVMKSDFDFHVAEDVHNVKIIVTVKIMLQNLID